VVRIIRLALTVSLALAVHATTVPAVAAEVDTFEIVSRGMDFDAPREVRSGWINFRLRNESSMVHFAVIERLPDGYGLKEQQEQVAPVFQRGMDLMLAGDASGAQAAFGELPPWFGDIVFIGGPGLTGAGQTSAVTQKLPPGKYLLECYVKTGGVFHSYNPAPDRNGMVREFTVVAEPSPVREPTATIELAISKAGGIEMRGRPVAGKQTIRVQFDGQDLHENFVGHDVHLVRLDAHGDSDHRQDELEYWMDWRQAGGLETPAPATFIGGVNEMPAGSTAYLHVSLESGDYAWVSEVPGAIGKGMLKTFSID
jgi:hypothetical protein